MKKRTGLLKLLPVAAFLLLTACSSSDQPEDKIEIPAGKEEVVLEDYTKEETVTFTATSDWNISVKEVSTRAAAAEWISVSPMSGKAGSVTITIIVDEEYDGEKDRTAEIVIQAGDGTPVKIKVVQKGNANTVQILPKKVKSIKTDWIKNKAGEKTPDGYNFSMTTSFTYDSKNRVTGVTREVITATTQRIDYSDNLVTLNYSSKMLNKWILSEDKIVSSIGYYEEDTNGDGVKETVEREVRKYSYTDSRVTLIEDIRGNGLSLYRNYSWLHGSVDKIATTGEYEYTRTFDYKKNANNLNIDLWYFLKSEIELSTMDVAALINLAGRRNKYLPVKSEGYNGYTSESEYTTTITYTKNTEGYITEILAENLPEGRGGNDIYSPTYKYIITYE